MSSAALKETPLAQVHVAAGARMFGQTTTKSINAIFSLKSYLPFDFLPNWKALRALPLDEQKRRMADPAVRRALVADEAGMKPKGLEFQGGGAATTDPRKPDYGNLFAMRDVAWDDPTVASLAAQKGQEEERSACTERISGLLERLNRQ